MSSSCVNLLGKNDTIAMEKAQLHAIYKKKIFLKKSLVPLAQYSSTHCSSPIMKETIIFMIFTLMNPMDASPMRIKRGLYAVGYNYGAVPNFSTHSYQPMPSYIPSPMFHAPYGSPIMQTAATYGTPIIQASSFGTPMVQYTPFGSHMIQAGPIVQNSPYGTPAISAGSTTKYIAVPKYLRIPLSKYVDPWKVGRGIYLPKYHHSQSIAMSK